MVSNNALTTAHGARNAVRFEEANPRHSVQPPRTTDSRTDDHEVRPIRWMIYGGGRLFQCAVALVSRLDYDRVLAVATQLPGVAAEGKDEEEAVQSLTDALRLAIGSYLDSQGFVPWDLDESTTLDADDVVVRRLSVLVDA